jgi:hypothetical protein
MKRYVAALLVVLGLIGVVGVLAIESGYAQNEKAAGTKCSEATLDGTYLFAENGVFLTAKGDHVPTPTSEAGYEVYNGNGKVRGVSSGNVGGEVFRKEPFTGTYTVKPDCTATVTYNVTYNGADPFVYDLFVAPDGSQFTLVVVKPSGDVRATFEVRATAKRVAQ